MSRNYDRFALKLTVDRDGRVGAEIYKNKKQVESLKDLRGHWYNSWEQQIHDPERQLPKDIWVFLGSQIKPDWLRSEPIDVEVTLLLPDRGTLLLEYLDGQIRLHFFDAIDFMIRHPGNSLGTILRNLEQTKDNLKCNLDVVTNKLKEAEKRPPEEEKLPSELPSGN